MKTLLYSLRDVKGSTVLSIDLTANIISESNHTLQINLPSGLTTLNRWDYQNKPVIYSDGKLFFLLCNKSASRKWAFETLMRHAICKVDERINNLNEARGRYLKELAA